MFAQNKTVVSATTDRSQILIGERIQLRLEAEIPENRPIRFFQLDSLPHFEFVNIGKIDTLNTATGTKLSQVIYLTSFDSGHWVVPALPLSESVMTDSIAIDVGFSSFDPAQPYHDIKDIMEVNPEEEKKPGRFWWYVAGGIVLAVLAYALLRKPAKQLPAPAVLPEDPYKQALQGLEKLQQEKLKPKVYYSRLTDIFRYYVEKRKGIHSLQQTTGDLVSQLKSIGIADGLYREMADVLQLSDFVKFARYETTGADDARALDIIRKTIDHIERSVKPVTTQPAS